MLALLGAIPGVIAVVMRLRKKCYCCAVLVAMLRCHRHRRLRCRNVNVAAEMSADPSESDLLHSAKNQNKFANFKTKLHEKSCNFR